MIKKVSIKGDRLTMDCDQQDYDFFFLTGLQLVIDAHFDGERKVVVVPYAQGRKALKKGCKTIDVSDEFADWCVEKAVNQCLREHLNRLESNKDVGKRVVKKSWTKDSAQDVRERLRFRGDLPGMPRSH